MVVMVIVMTVPTTTKTSLSKVLGMKKDNYIVPDAGSGLVRKQLQFLKE